MNVDPVLLVEDDDNDVMFMQYAWKKAELTNSLSVVNDGQSAADYLSGVNQYSNREVYPLPCLVLLDLKLPTMDGFEVLRWIRQTPTFHNLLVIVVTSSSAESDARLAYSLGANSYIIKPSNPERLGEFVKLLKQYWLGWNYAPAGSRET